VAGLGHLRRLGLATAMLYVDDENQQAVRMYESLGFTRWKADVMYGTSSECACSPAGNPKS
jgi:mycothiol synthase